MPPARGKVETSQGGTHIGAWGSDAASCSGESGGSLCEERGDSAPWTLRRPQNQRSGGWSHRLERKGARGCRAARGVIEGDRAPRVWPLPMQGRIGLGHSDIRGVLSPTWVG